MMILFYYVTHYFHSRTHVNSCLIRAHFNAVLLFYTLPPALEDLGASHIMLELELFYELTEDYTESFPL
jgi:hypothetical protein